MIILESHKVTDLTTPIRLSDYAHQIFSIIPSRKGIKKAIKRGEILVNGQSSETGHWVQIGELIQLVDLGLKSPKPLKLELRIIFEDEDLAVVVKPAGIPVSGNQFRTLQNALVFNLKDSQNKDKLPWPLPVHRLDAMTHGLILVAKTRSAVVTLSKQFENKTIYKTYQAIVHGLTPSKGIIEMALDLRMATTRFELLTSGEFRNFGVMSRLLLNPETGRTHQLRRHLKGLGNPIVGDRIYDKQITKPLRGKGLFLSAIGLEFTHPTSKLPCAFNILPPNKFQRILPIEKKEQ